MSVRISLTLEASEMFLSLHMIFSTERAAVVWAILERISSFDPSLEMIAPKNLKFSTSSSLWPFILISFWKPFGLYVTTFVLSGQISILYLVVAISRRSTRTPVSSSSSAFTTMSSAKRKLVISRPFFIYSGERERSSKMSKVSSTLGVTITNELRWNTHVSNICTKANLNLGFLRRKLYACPQEVKEAAYKGLVRTVLEYSSSVWDLSGLGLQDELEKVQNRVARFVIGNCNYATESNNGILGHLKWESFKKRKRGSRFILLYKSLKAI